MTILEYKNINLNHYSCDIIEYHKTLKDVLNRKDFEYLIWQEWKEGYARYIENLIRDKIGLDKNSTRLSDRFNRTCFYEIGSRYISEIIENNFKLTNDLKGIYREMENYEK